MKIAVLTSSRADYGIYLPLLKRMQEDSSIHFDLIVFGSHCADRLGATVQQIKEDGFQPFIEINNLLDGDSPLDISRTYALTVQYFAEFWNVNSDYDWILALGDRFEMAAAVNSGIPFGLNFAHIHAGETTLGAIDNIYRHQITLASKLHFVSTEKNAEKVKSIMGDDNTVEVVGALGLEHIEAIQLLSIEQFEEIWQVDLNVPTVLMTVHPETMNIAGNENNIIQLGEAIKEIVKTHQIVVTLPNADTMGSVYRNFFIQLQHEYPRHLFAIENLGSQSYFTCMKFTDILIGNTSSGIIEAASFGKYVINLGNRQLGRESSSNVVHVAFDAAQIISNFNSLKGQTYNGPNVYFKKDTSEKIIQRLKK